MRVLFGLFVVLLLVGCGSEEAKIVQEAKRDFKVLYSYDEDKIRPVLDDVKTVEELAEDYLLDRLGIGDDEPEYKDAGVLEGQGIFVESAVYDGGSIPNVTVISEEDVRRLELDEWRLRSLKKQEEDFERLKELRQDVLDRQYARDNTGRDKVEDEIRRRLVEYEQDKGE